MNEQIPSHCLSAISNDYDARLITPFERYLKNAWLTYMGIRYIPSIADITKFPNS